MNNIQFIEQIKKLMDTFIANWIYLIDEYEKEIEKDLDNLDNEVNGNEGYAEEECKRIQREFYNEPCKSEITD